jgi:hypothetical protein
LDIIELDREAGRRCGIDIDLYVEGGKIPTVGRLEVVATGMPSGAGSACLSDEAPATCACTGETPLLLPSATPVLFDVSGIGKEMALSDLTSETTAPLPASDSKSGGGSNSCLDVDAAYAIASAPYGIPNLAKFSLDEISFSCSGVGPAFGYVNSVRTAVWVSGADIEFREIVEDEAGCWAEEAMVCVERWREMVRKGERPRPEPDWEGRW